MVMELNNERKAFEKWAFNASGGFANFDRDSYGEYWPDKLNLAWRAWQGAKTQAVPETHVLVPKKPTLDMLIAALAVISTGIGEEHIEIEIIKCWEKMIEASQEQAYDCYCRNKHLHSEHTSVPGKRKKDENRN